MAHEAVVIDHKEDIWDAGTTTLIGGVLVPLNEGRGPVCIFSLNSVYLRACVYVYVYTSRWFVICVRVRVQKILGGCALVCMHGTGLHATFFLINSVYLRACVYVYVYTSRWYVICVCVCVWCARAKDIGRVSRLCICMAQVYMLLFFSCGIFYNFCNVR